MNRARVNQSLDTRDWGRAGRRAAELEQELISGKIRKGLTEAFERFFAQCEVSSETRRKYQRWAKFLQGYASAQEIEYVDHVSVDHIEDYRATRETCSLTWQKELQFLRQFFSFCVDRKWIEESPAKLARMPEDPKPKERAPYTREEIAAILSACDRFGRHPYERLRARAMILLMRFYGLRISDVATLEKSRVSGGSILVQAKKNGAIIWLPLYPEVARALDCLPTPHGAGPDCPYFFWTGHGKRESIVKMIERSLLRMFEKSGVESAHAHRFRHTLATEILARGGSIEDAANILGDSPDVIRKHYLKWSPEYQARTVRIMGLVHDTYPLREDLEEINPMFSIDKAVAKVGVELHHHIDNTQVIDSLIATNPKKALKPVSLRRIRDVEPKQ